MPIATVANTQKISASTPPTILTGSDSAARNLCLDSSCLISLSILGCTKGSAKSAKVPVAYMIPLLAAGAFNAGGGGFVLRPRCSGQAIVPDQATTREVAHVRFGSKAVICSAKRHVRFTPESGSQSVRVACPLRAKSGHRRFYLILRFATK